MPSAEVMRRRRRRVLWLLAAAAVLLLGGVGMRHQLNRRQIRADLQAAQDKLDHDDPGWRIEGIMAARAEIPNADNSARCVVAAHKLLPKNWPPLPLDEALRSVVRNEQLTAEQFERLNKELDAVGPAVEEARKLKNLPRGRHRLTIAPNVIATLLPDQQDARTITTLLRYDVLRLAQAGDLKGALASCRAMLNAGRSLGDEPLLISQLIRMACVGQACDMVERALSQGEPAEDDLAALQREFEAEDRFPMMRVFLRGERAFAHAAFEEAERGDLDPRALEGLSRSSASTKLSFFPWRVRDQARREHPRMLELFTERIAAADLPVHEQLDADRRLADALRDLPPEAQLTRLLIPAVDKVTTAARRMHANVRCVAVLLAAERYRRANGKWPEKLTDLVPKYFAAVPLDPFDGKPLRSKRLAYGVVVYSVGEDGVDDGGKFEAGPAGGRPADVGFRLWDVGQRRRLPKP
jgi:hypothetical protein